MPWLAHLVHTRWCNHCCWVDSGKPSDRGYVSFSAYYRKWRTAYPQLKVSCPAEDICGYCFVFTNCNRDHTSHSAAAVADCRDDDEDEDGDDAPPEEEAAAEMEAMTATMAKAATPEEEAAVIEEQLPAGSVGEQLLVNMSKLNLDHPEAAATPAEEARELLLIESAKHIRMAKAQRALMRLWSIMSKHTFIIDYSQNMEILVFNDKQQGPTYYFSPVVVYNLGVVHHAHMYNNGTIGKHIYAYVYNEALGKKGANNVASLIVKMLQ